MTASTTGTHPAPSANRTVPRGLTIRILVVEVYEQLLAIVREPTALVFSVAMPVGFFALFNAMWGADERGGVIVGTSMLATFGTFGVVGVTLLNPGIGVADDRERGWLRMKRVSATPVPVTLTAKVAATVPYAVAVLAAMTLVAAVGGTLELDAASWGRLALVLTIGALPFAFVGLAVGLVATPNATAAILNAVYIPSAVASGLWMPLDALPDVVSRVAPWLPTYHLAELGRAQLEGAGSVIGHVLALLAATGVGAFVAGLAYRRGRP